MKLLVQMGANVDETETQSRNTALFYTVAYNNIEATLLLIGHGADINHRNLLGWTPLFEAAFRDRSQIISTLINQGAQINEKDAEGKTALFWAAWQQNVLSARILSRLGGSCFGHIQSPELCQ